MINLMLWPATEKYVNYKVEKEQSMMKDWLASQLLALVGFIALLRILKDLSFKILWIIKTYVPSFYRSFHYTKVYGEWAAVSGCTAGIGLSLVKEMAKRGHNIVLISRNEEKLSALARELENKYNIKTKVIISDAFNRHSTEQAALQLASLDIGILVNNVGVIGSKGIEMFHEFDINWVTKILTVNAGNAVMTMRHVLPNMLKAKKGIVVNMCSSTSYTPVPCMSLYGSSKIFLDILSLGLGKELSGTGVQMQSFCPLFVQSNMTQFSNIIHTFFSASGETYAKAFMDKLGTCRRTGGILIFDLFYGISLQVIPHTLILYLLFYIQLLLRHYKL